MTWDPQPTAADYAAHNAREAQDEAKALRTHVVELERRVERLEAIVREQRNGGWEP